MSKKGIAMLLVAFITIFSFTAFSGCAEKDENKSGVSIKMEDMPYGASLRDEKSAYKLRIQYDKRYLDDAQLKAVTDYYYAIQTSDVDLYGSVMFPYFEEYVKTYSSDRTINLQYVLDTFNASIEDSVGTDFSIDMCDVTDVNNNSIESGSDTIIEKLDAISQEQDGINVSDKITNSCKLTVTLYVTSGDTSNSISNDTLYIFEMDGNQYIMI